MGKTPLFVAAVAVAVALSLTACHEKPCETNIASTYTVKNATDMEIVVTGHHGNMYGDSDAPVTIAPGASEIVSTYTWITSCGQPEVMPDMMTGDMIAPFGATEGGMAFYGEKFKMTIGGEAVSADIWYYKHWTYAGGRLSQTYTLTVTDTLLTELSAKGQ